MLSISPDFSPNQLQRYKKLWKQLPFVAKNLKSWSKSLEDKRNAKLYNTPLDQKTGNWYIGVGLLKNTSRNLVSREP